MATSRPYRRLSRRRAKPKRRLNSRLKRTGIRTKRVSQSKVVYVASPGLVKRPMKQMKPTAFIKMYESQYSVHRSEGIKRLLYGEVFSLAQYIHILVDANSTTLASAEKLTHVELLSLKVVVYPAPLAFIGGAPPTCGYMWTKEDTFAAADILSKNQYGKTIVDRKPLIIKFNIASYLKQKGLPSTIPLLDTYMRDTFSKLFAEAPKLVIWGFSPSKPEASAIDVQQFGLLRFQLKLKFIKSNL